jgi:aminoglycoside phosphotransferase (APT) family kinase protein
VAGFVTDVLGIQPTRIARTYAFATNAVYEVDADGQRLILKASMNRDALRAEAWACMRSAEAGFPAPEILAGVDGICDEGMSAFVMRRVFGDSITPGHAAFGDLGAAVRRLHEIELPGFGSLADATWNQQGEFTLPHGSWLGFLRSISSDTRRLADRCALAPAVADAVDASLETHAEALAAVVGSLCHGDLKANHIFVDADRLAGVIDWGDAVVGDPFWELARYAHRGDALSLSLLLRGYDPEGSMAGDIAWRIPLYGVLWMLVDAIVDHRLGSDVDELMETAMRDILRANAPGSNR